MNLAVRLVSASLAVVATAALATSIMVASHFTSEWNWLWLLGFPFLYAVLVFRRHSLWMRIWALPWLEICAFFTMTITTAAIGGGR